MKTIIVDGNEISYQLAPQTGYSRKMIFCFKGKEIHREPLFGSDKKKFNNNDQQIEEFLLSKAKKKLRNFFKKEKMSKSK